MKKNKIIIAFLVLIGLMALGGWSYYKSTVPIDIGHPQKGDFVVVGDMSVPRYYHEAILLDDGTVLVIDKGTRKITNGNGVTSADIYNPETHKFTLVGNMNVCRQDYSATKLKNGKILITGGRNYNLYLGSTELYNPQTQKFEKDSEMKIQRANHTATLLKDGRVLITGGGFRFANESEIYDPNTSKFEFVPKMNIQRFDHSAILLRDGKVLIVGGVGVNNGKFSVLASAEIYDTKTNKFKIIGNTNVARKNVNLYLLKNGNVLISGGIKDRDKNKGMDSIYAREIELYNPRTNKFTIIAKRTSEANEPAEVLLEDDKILFAGSQSGVGLSLRWYATSEIFDPKTRKFTQGKNMNYTRSCHKMTLLKDGNVLITGSDGKEKTAELYIAK